MATLKASRSGRIALYYQRANARLNRYSNPAVTEAPDRIARLRGTKDYDAMADEYHLRYLLVMNAANEMPGNMRVQRAKVDLLASNPSNYLRQPPEYLGVDVVFRLLFGAGRRVRGLQLASNYGPYLHYLRSRPIGPSMVGIDIDPLAVRYGRLIGEDIFRATAEDLPFLQNTFDWAFSHNFLVIDYEEHLSWSRPGRRSAEGFSASVLSEVARVLRPGGIFISSREFLCSVQTDRAGLMPHPDFQEGWFDQKIAPQLKDIQIFLKP